MRWILSIGVAVLVVALPARVCSEPVPTDEKPKQPSVAERLAEPVDMLLAGPKPFGKDPKIQDALDLITNHYKIGLSYNEEAFKLTDPNYSFDTYFGVPLLDKGSFAVSKELSAAKALRRILARVPTDGDAAHAPTFLVRKGGIEITTVEALRREVYGETSDDQMQPLVNIDVEDRPFKAVLKTLADQSGLNIVVDARVAEKATKTMVNVQLANTPVDRAVRLLADMSGWKSLQMGNLIYVTTPENVAALQAEEDHRRARQHRQQEQSEVPGPKGSGSGS